MNMSSQLNDGYSSSGSEHTIPSPPPTPEHSNESVVAAKEQSDKVTKSKRSPKKRKTTTKGSKLTPWRADDKLDEVLFALALVEKPLTKKPGMKDWLF